MPRLRGRRRGVVSGVGRFIAEKKRIAGCDVKSGHLVGKVADGNRQCVVVLPPSIVIHSVCNVINLSLVRRKSEPANDPLQDWRT